jgi:potassium uptake TrkH family protein
MVVIYDAGFDITNSIRIEIHKFYSFSLILFFLVYALRFIFPYETKIKTSIILFRLIALLFLLFVISVESIAKPWFETNYSLLTIFAHPLIIHIILIFIFIVELSRYSLKLFKQKINPALIFIGSFLFIILVGTGLLLLPKATTGGINFIDALFTSTSAVCVTGLTTVDTATHFTMIGKIYILILIQIGGLGVMTFTSFFGLFFMGSGSFQSNLYLKDFINSENLSDIFRSLVKIIIITFSIEIIGAFFIYYSIDTKIFPNTMDNLGFSLFHSISAFCNAGFSTMSMGLYDINLRFSYNIHLTIAFLVILGGIGFPIIFNYYNLLKHYLRNKYRQLLFNQKYNHVPYIIQINSRLVIYTTILFIILGTGTFFITEYNNSLQDHTSYYGKIVTSFFLSVTPRTAGFNTVDTMHLMPTTILFTIFLMWVGASSGSTGGGIKTGTFAVALMNIISIARGKDRIEVMKREVSQDSVSKAFAVIVLSLLVIGIAIVLIGIFDSDKSLLAIAFECFSAFGTVGLSMGLTPNLSEASKYVLVFTMFLGRVGTLTLIVAFVNKVNTLSYRYPEKNIIIG